MWTFLNKECYLHIEKKAAFESLAYHSLKIILNTILLTAQETYFAVIVRYKLHTLKNIFGSLGNGCKILCENLPNFLNILLSHSLRMCCITYWVTSMVNTLICNFK